MKTEADVTIARGAHEVDCPMCGKPVLWVGSYDGATYLLDPAPNAQGEYALVGPQRMAYALRVGEPSPAPLRYRRHRCLHRRLVPR